MVGALLLEAERSLIDELDEPFMTDTLWLKVVDDAHRDVGAALASQWTLPASVTKAIAGCDAYEESAGRASCTNLVRYANALAKRQGLYVGAVDADEVAAIIAEGRRILGVDEAIENACSTGLAERVEAITGAAAATGRPRPDHDVRERSAARTSADEDLGSNEPSRAAETRGARRRRARRRWCRSAARPTRRPGSPSAPDRERRPRRMRAICQTAIGDVSSAAPATISGSPAATSSGNAR